MVVGDTLEHPVCLRYAGPGRSIGFVHGAQRVGIGDVVQVCQNLDDMPRKVFNAAIVSAWLSTTGVGGGSPQAGAQTPQLLLTSRAERSGSPPSRANVIEVHKEPVFHRDFVRVGDEFVDRVFRFEEVRIERRLGVVATACG